LFAMKASRHASIAAATASAAHDTLVALYPTQQGNLDSLYTSYMSQIPNGSDKLAGVTTGQKAAAEILARRANDGSSIVVAYTPGTDPGDWQPTPPAFAPAMDPGWGKVTPFLLRTGNQFRPGPPPALTSETYTRDFEEMVGVGAAASVTRTPDQTTTALFWAPTGTQMWNQVVQQLAIAHGLNATQTARAFAALALVGADAFIGSWDAKYTYNWWRPVTAIRNADVDGNPQTAADPAWTPLLNTPPFPEYTSGHATYAGAAETVLTSIFGSSPGSFQIASAATPSVIHHYTSFAVVAIEVSNARVWAGIHWRTSCIIGRAQGQQIAGFDLHQGLQPSRK
jgi:membrane-associated phospholipid phosphatase